MGLKSAVLAAPVIYAALTVAAVPQDLDVPYVPTPRQVVQVMLEMAKVGPEDIVYDLGSGDGRIVIAAAKDYGVRRAVGIDLNPDRIAEAKQNARHAGVEDQVSFREDNIFTTDFSEATVVTMYLLTTVNRKLRPRLLDELRPGTRLVSHQFDMGEWKPDESRVVEGRDVHFWVVPAKVEGMWGWTVGSDEYKLELSQIFQEVSGRLYTSGEKATIDNARLIGDHLTFDATVDGKPVRFDGRISGDEMEASLDADGDRDVKIRRLQR